MLLCRSRRNDHLGIESMRKFLNIEIKTSWGVNLEKLVQVISKKCDLEKRKKKVFSVILTHIPEEIA